MPNLPGEGAARKEVLHGLGLLVAKGTHVVVREAVSEKAVHRPAALLHREPHEELDAKRCPWLPREFPVIVTAGPIAGAGRVEARCRPSPSKGVGGGRELDMPDLPPKVNVL